MARGILGYGTHVPYYRLRRDAIAAALGSGGGSGTRAVASYDEDATSMAVEAARVALRSFDAPTPATVYFASVTPPYLDKTNANAIHAALDYPSNVFAADLAGSARSTTAAVEAALHDTRPVLIGAADVRTGRPGSGDEASSGDAGAAVMIGSDVDAPVIAEWLGSASRPTSSSTAGVSRDGTTRACGRNDSASRSISRSSPRRPPPRSSRPSCRPPTSTR